MSTENPLKKIPMYSWGAIVIFAGAVSNFIQPAPKNRAEAAGRAVAIALFWVIGLVLVVWGLVRKFRTKPKGKAKASRPAAAGSANAKPAPKSTASIPHKPAGAKPAGTKPASAQPKPGNSTGKPPVKKKPPPKP